MTTNGAAVEYAYDDAGQRVRRTDASGTVRYLYAGADLFAELDSTGVVLRAYSYFPGVDQPHAVRVDTAQTAGYYFYATEAPGHVAGLFDESNSIVDEYRYRAFGEAEWAQEGVPQPLRYMARELDAGTGLYQVRARWYDPQLERFVSEDPVGLAGGVNAYAYVGNDPVNLTDPSGLCPPGHSWYGADIGGQMFWLRCPGAESLTGLTHPPRAGSRSVGYVGRRRSPQEYEDALRDVGPKVAAVQPYISGAYSVIYHIALTVVGGRLLGPLFGRGAPGVPIVGEGIGGALGSGGEHIVLGLRAYRLEEIATKVGGKTLLHDPNWRITLMEALGNPATKFTVSLDGFSGTTVYSQVMGAASRGNSPLAQYTEWEMAQLLQAGRLSTVTFLRNGAVVLNPF